MNFDKSFIRIRRRRLLEIFDLSLKVIRRYPGEFILYLTLGALMMTVINVAITYRIRDGGTWQSSAYSFWTNLVLILIEAQVGTMFVTSFLGKAMFESRPTWQNVIQAVISSWLPMLWTQGFLRGVLLLLLMIGFANLTSNDLTSSIVVAWLVSIPFLLVRVFRPYAPEIIILERTPMFSKASNVISLRKRSKSLHSAVTGDSISLAALTVIFGVLLVLIVYAGIAMTLQLLGLVDDEFWVLVNVAWPVALWLVCGVFAVIRFLSYIDNRIRQEGWEVELLIRAEATKMETEATA
ncbi:MAG: hypothetical protein R3C03_09730 [Pirellulaceae bacterium]